MKSPILIMGSFFLLMVMARCASQQAGKEYPPINPVTVLPKNFTWANSPRNLSKRVKIPHKLIQLARIARPKVEVREGPGAHFSLKRNILLGDQIVIKLDRIGVWQKIVTVDERVKGWIHHKTLKAIKNYDKLLELDLSCLQRVFAINPIKIGYDFQTLTKVPVAISKGAMFVALKKNSKKILVFISQTNSVIWLPKRNLR